MMDLLYTENYNDYCELRNIVLSKYPNADINDASDDVHPHRFSIDNIELDESYLEFLMREGISGCSLNFQLRLRVGDKEKRKPILDIFERLVKEKAL